MELHTLVICALVGLVGSSAPEHPADDGGEWGYHHEHGEIPPEDWATIAGDETCAGQSQSPIDLNSAVAVEKEFGIWFLDGYTNDQLDGPRVMNIVNNGHGVTMYLAGDYLLWGGGLPTTYKGLQFHLHWGEDLNTGSEHSKDGKTFPGELHIEHYALQYENEIPTAFTSPMGLAVLGFFIEEGEHNEAWDPIISKLKEVRYYQDEYDFEEPIQLSSLFPFYDLTRFYRYNGSLTTPGCYETVVWTIFEATVKMSAEQIAEFRTLSEKAFPGDPEGGEFVTDNHRPVQPLNDRTLYAGFLGSCENRCGVYTPMSVCHCNLACYEYKDCCFDFRTQCYEEVCWYVPRFGNEKQRKQPNN